MYSALAASAPTTAPTVMPLLVTAAWEQAKAAVGGLQRRVRPKRAETVVLSETGASPGWKTTVLRGLLLSGLEMSRPGGLWPVRSRAGCGAWWPPAAGVDERWGVLAQFRTALADADPPRSATITLQTTTLGNNWVNHVGRDVPITIRE